MNSKLTLNIVSLVISVVILGVFDYISFNWPIIHNLNNFTLSFALLIVGLLFLTPLLSNYFPSPATRLIIVLGCVAIISDVLLFLGFTEVSFFLGSATIVAVCISVLAHIIKLSRLGVSKK